MIKWAESSHRDPLEVSSVAWGVFQEPFQKHIFCKGFHVHEHGRLPMNDEATEVRTTDAMFERCLLEFLRGGIVETFSIYEANFLTFFNGIAFPVVGYLLLSRDKFDFSVCFQFRVIAFMWTLLIRSVFFLFFEYL